MIDFLIDSEEDITLLTCKECAFDIYRDLVEAGCELTQSEIKILKELNSGSEVFEVTKLVAEGYEEDAYFIFGMEDEKFLRDRIIVIDSCIDEYVNEDKIPSGTNVIHMEDIEDEDDFDEELMNAASIAAILDDPCAISSFVKSFFDKNDEEDEDDCICDECLAVREIMDMEVKSLEEALREAYRFGREAALIGVMEDIDSMLYK